MKFRYVAIILYIVFFTNNAIISDMPLNIYSLVITIVLWLLGVFLILDGVKKNLRNKQNIRVLKKYSDDFTNSLKMAWDAIEKKSSEE